MREEVLFIGGFYHGKRVSVRATTTSYKANSLNPVQTYYRNFIGKRVWDYSSKPATTFLQEAYFFYPANEYPNWPECEALLLPSDWHEVEGSRQVIEEKEESDER